MTDSSPAPARRNPLGTVYFKCLAMIFLTASAVATLMTIQSISIAKNAARDAVLLLGREAVILTASDAGGAFRFGLGDDLRKRIEATIGSSKEHALGGIFIRPDGSVLAEGGSFADGERDRLIAHASGAAASGEITVDGDAFVTGAPVIFGDAGEIVGALAMSWTPDKEIEKIAGAKYRAIGAGVLALLVFMGIAAFVLRMIIARPMRQVEEAMANVAKGEYHVDVPLKERSDEIGGFARALESLRTDLLAAEEATQDALLKGAGFDGSSAALVLTDRDFKIVGVNPAFVALAEARSAALSSLLPGFAAEAPLGTRIDDALHAGGFNPRDADPTDFPRTLRLDVKGVSIKLSIGQIFGDDGDLAGYVAEWVDATAESRNQAILSGLDASQIRIDFNTDGLVQTGNALFEERLGAMKDAKLEAMVEPRTGTIGDVQNQLSAGKVWFGKAQINDSEGTARILDASICPIRSPSGTALGSVLLGNDITDHARQMEEAESERQRMTEAQVAVVDALRVGLSAMSGGDMTAKIGTVFSEEYEGLRSDFNIALEQLDQAMGAVITNAGSIQNEVGEISSAADDLSKRTEHQAATLEQTAAALTEITRSVGSAASGAKEANRVVEEARENADQSGGVVSEAVEAMGEIKTSSDQISKIIDVIDDISFQTNLLALNAGVEAARAGDAGRGFAVVASEVRALAQRSSNAAREINDLILRSGSQVERGVTLVGKTGEALKRIVSSVSDIADHVGSITASTAEQSSALTEINSAMNQLDQVTQQNAAMFEETTAASHALSSEANNLATTMSRFTTSSASLDAHASAPAGEKRVMGAATGAVAPPLGAEPNTEKPSVLPTFIRQKSNTSLPNEPAMAEPEMDNAPPGDHSTPTPSALATQGATALAEPVHASDDWEDF
ncbi:MAG: methyl-accepting chemotaxis protein [Pseudomonadota bacterium]